MALALLGGGAAAVSAAQDMWHRRRDPIGYYALPGERPWQTLHRISTPQPDAGPARQTPASEPGPTSEGR